MSQHLLLRGADSVGEIPPAPRTSLKRIAMYVGILALFVAVMGLAWHGIEMRPVELLKDLDNIADYISCHLPGDWSWGWLWGAIPYPVVDDFMLDLRIAFYDWDFYAEQMVVTIYMALWGTFLAVICAIPFGLMSASNISPIWLRQPVRRMMDALRAINELVFALMFVTAVGLGPMAGMLALWVHTTGILAKLFSEAVEAMDRRPVEGIRATGAGVVDEIVYGVIPQVTPLWISYALYRFESNVRSATVVGLIGGGGIGFILYEKIRSFAYQDTAAVILIVVVSVAALDSLSSFLRKQFL